jgi:hypothetical protein
MPPQQFRGISRGDDFLNVQELGRTVRQELDELPEGNEGTIEALQESVRQNRKGDKVMLCDELKAYTYDDI